MLDVGVSDELIAPQSQRVPFSGSLGVADFDGQSSPNALSFQAVSGFNLSHRGISFATNHWPATDRLMVALGDDNSPVLVSARVIACSKQADQDAAAPYEVHCEFDRWHT